MRSNAVGLLLFLGFLGQVGPLVGQDTLVILGPDNGFRDEIEPGVAIFRAFNASTKAVGPLKGENLEFSCGSCDVATFDDVEEQIGEAPRGQICGYVSDTRNGGGVPAQIVLNGDLLCVRSKFTNVLFELDLETWSDANLNRPNPCIDADGSGACVSSGGLTSYFLQPAPVNVTALLEDLVQRVIELNRQKGIPNSLDAKLDAAFMALDDLNANNDFAAVNALDAFVHSVEAQSGNKIPEGDADALIAQAQAIIAALSGS